MKLNWHKPDFTDLDITKDTCTIDHIIRHLFVESPNFVPIHHVNRSWRSLKHFKTSNCSEYSHNDITIAVISASAVKENKCLINTQLNYSTGEKVRKQKEYIVPVYTRGEHLDVPAKAPFPHTSDYTVTQKVTFLIYQSLLLAFNTMAKTISCTCIHRNSCQPQA